MKNILIISSSPRKNGNSQMLCEQFKKGAEEKGHTVTLIRLMEKKIGFCRACYGCSQTGVCVQKDDFMDILRLAHEADAIIAEAPIYYNCMAAQMMTVINRLCCTFACKTYQVGPKKRVGMFLSREK